MNNQNQTPAVICPQCRQQSGQTQRECEQRQDVLLSKRCFDSHPWFSRARIPGKIWPWTVQTEHVMLYAIMQIRRMLTKCSASKLTYLFILKQWYLLHEFPIFLSPFYFFMRIKRFDLKKSRQNAITVGYKEAQCNSVTQSKLFNNRVTNTNWLFRRNKAEAEKTNQSHCQFSMTYDGFNPVFNGW